MNKSKKSNILSAKRKAARKEIIISAADSKGAKSKSAGKKIIAFGSVTVKVGELNKNELKRNVKAGQTALARAKGKIIKPGIKLGLSKKVPLFYAAPGTPDLIIREQDGKKEKGILVRGKFKPCQ